MTTSSHVPTSTEIVIESFQLGEPDANEMAVVYNRGDFNRTGEDFAAVQIRIGIDEWFDEISVDLNGSGDLDVLDRTIKSLTQVRDALAALYEGREYRAGRCLTVDHNGRCLLLSDHTEGKHLFPTAQQADAESTSPARFAQRTQVVSA